MDKEQLVALVRAILAQMSEDYSIYQVDPQQRLANLGMDSARIDELRNRLYHALNGEEPSAADMVDTPTIGPASRVDEIASGLVLLC